MRIRMKKILLALIPTAITASAGFATASELATVYGRADVSYQYENYKYGATNEDGSTFVLKSNASRFGVKGEKALDDAIKTIYQLEWEVDFTDEDKKNNDGDNILKARNTFIGLSGNFGTVIAGINDTPLKASQGKVDLFNDGDADMKSVILGENRENSIVQYSTPAFFNGLVATLAVIPGEQKEDGVTPDVNNGPADAVSASIAYTMENLFAAFAVDQDVQGYDSMRLTGQYKISSVNLGLIYQTSEPSDGTDDSEDGVLVSAAYGLGKNDFKIQYASSDMMSVGGEQISLGVDHKLAEKTKLYAFLSNYTADNDAKEKMLLAAGLQHSF